MLSFIFVGENFVGLRDLSELLFCLLRVVEVFIGMPLDGKFSVGFFNLLIVGILLNTENLIETSFDGHFGR